MTPRLFPVPDAFRATAFVTADRYQELYQRSLTHADDFWSEQAKIVDWFKPFHSVSRVSWSAPVSIEWFLGGQLNASYNCLDRHLAQHGDKVAIFWEPDSPDEPTRTLTYQELHDEVCRMSNVLRARGVRRGDRVTIYLPMIPEAVMAMLACARLGAPHSVIFGGFSPDAIADRIGDCGSKWVITADEGRRGGKRIPLKHNVDEALRRVDGVRSVFVVKHTNASVPWQSDRDIDLREAMVRAAAVCAPEVMDAEDPLFLLYTSGSTNKPKGVLHTTGGYLVYAALTHRYVFDYRPGDVYWCAADVGWITGHSYIVYGPLANAATQVLFEGIPSWPTSDRLWRIVDKFAVRTLYTAPTLIRALMAQGEGFLSTTSRQSLRLLGSVGEPINPEAWLWYHQHGGRGQCPVVDTWWQTETGGIMITPLPGATDLKPGSATRPFFGVEPVMLDESGREVSGPGRGLLAIKRSWPGQMRGVYRAPEKFFATYFQQFPGYYFTGDGCTRDEDGYFWITGRVDDVLNVSGHRIGTAEIESALVAHPAVSESAAVGVEHQIKGQALYVFVTLRAGLTGSEQLRQELIDFVAKEIGAFARPDFLQWAPGLPKTRSGKIMRRILRKIAAGETNDLGDTTTLADPAVVEDLKRERVATHKGR
jgi:acetyl-CoA synthetase